MKVIGTDDDFYDEGYDDDDRSINNRLTFSQEKLYGRQDELVTLHGLYAGLCSRSSRDDEVPSPVAIIDGYSGTGKSALVRCFFDELKVNRKNGYARDFLLVQGKFEELQISDPLSTMADAFQGLCHTLLREEKKETLDRVRKSINASMGVDACALASVIPSIKELLGKSEELALVSSLSSDSGWNRLQYLVQNLLKAVCSEDCPLIMFLDDLQWADPASISLLRAVLSDSSLKKFMFIGAFRGEEIDDQHDIKMLFSEARRKSSKTIERIDLLNLSLRDIKSFIADSLRLSVDECETLTEFVYDKTRGNIYFTMQMMEELQRRNFLFYSIISFQWEWKLGGVNLNAILSENLEDAMAEKIQHAPSKLQRVLVLASYTRSTFHVKTIHVLMSADGSEITKEDLVRILDMAVLEGFLLNRMGSLLYRFAHDRIQQAAYSLVKAGEARDNLRLMIGNTLFSLTENNREDWMLFVAADHLNSSCISGGDSLALARLNLLCGEKARAVAAYVPCAFYLQHAIKYLRKVENHWISQYDLSLRIVRSLCDVELCLGKFHSGDDLAKELIDNARNLEDRLPTLLSLAMSKGRQDRHEEAYELCEKALFDLRAIPRRLQALQMIRDRFIVQRMLRRYTDNDILQLSRLESERKLSEVHFLSEGQLRAYYCGDMVAYMFCCLRSLRIAFKYGLSASSAYSFAAYGLFLDIACEDHEGALRMAQLARQILTRVEESVDSKTPKALALTAIGYSIEAWSCSREHVLETGHLAHQAGMESGNVEVGFLNWTVANNFAYATGYPLGPVETSGREILQQLQLYNADSVLPIFQQVRLPITYFMGLEERVINWEELGAFDALLSSKSDTYRSSFGYLARLELALFFGELELAERMSNALQPYMAHEAQYAIIVKFIFYSGLTYSGLARKGGKLERKYRSKAASWSHKMAKICRTKGRNPLHKCFIMKADLLACHCKDAEKIARAYDEGISAAVKLGYVQDAALGSELAGEFFLAMNESDRARQYICRACDLYQEWGAMAKVNHLTKHRPTYVQTIQVDEAVSSSDSLPTWVSGEASTSRKTADVELLSGRFPQADDSDSHLKEIT